MAVSAPLGVCAPLQAPAVAVAVVGYRPVSNAGDSCMVRPAPRIATCETRRVVGPTVVRTVDPE
jgi:hypothetical protein